MGGWSVEDQADLMANSASQRASQEIYRARRLIMGYNDRISAIPSADADKIAEAIGVATRHVKRIARREHLKADRVESVNLFIVSLRRELIVRFGSQSGGMVDAMCRKELWYDAGDPSPAYSGTCPSHYQLENWARIAKRMSDSSSAQVELIQADLEELERSLHGFKIQVDEAERINTEGDDILVGLEELFS